MNYEKVTAGDSMGAGLAMRCSFHEQVLVHGHYNAVCLDANGNVKWVEEFDNLVTTVGKNDLLDKYLAGSGYTAAWYLGLKGTGSAVAGDTMASHASWSEVNPYTGNRPAPTWAAASAGSKATSAAVSFSITVAGPTTVAGAFLSTTNTGATGILYSAGDFTASRSVVSGDTLNVTYTASA